MARVNHRKVLQLLNEKRSKITDRQFFVSRILAGHFEDMAAAQTRRYGYNRRVRVKLKWEPKSNDVACTDNQVVTINCGSRLITKVRGRENRYWLVCGLFAHELGHVLYTDFLASQTYHNALGSYRWYPAQPILRTADERYNEAELWEYAKADPNNLLALQLAAQEISNVLEDGHIENCMLNHFPGSLGYALETLREQQLSETPTLTQMIEKEEEGERPIFGTILQLILTYAKYGVIRYGDEPKTDDRVQTVFDLLSEIDRALMTTSGKERLDVVNTILVRCWAYVKDYLELLKKRLDAAASAGIGSEAGAGIVSELSGLTGASAPGTGSTAPVPQGESEDSSVTEEERKATRAEAAGGSGEENEPKEENEETEGSGSSFDESTEDGDPAAESETMEGKASGSGSGASEKRGAADHETGRITLEQTDHVSDPVGGTTEHDDEYERQMNENAAADIERILDRMAERAACTQLENERLQELNDTAQNISYGNVHSGVSIRVKRIPSVDEELVEQYNTVAPELLAISRQLQKSLTRQLKESRRGGKQTGLMMGRRLDAHTLHRTDGKVFYKNALPNEIPQLAVALLLDESGSMYSYDRRTYARAAAIILYDFCQSLDIPVMVYGHSTEGSAVALYSYAEFDSIDNDDRYRMMDIDARENNRDGAALRFVAEQLSKRPEEVKMLILVSDGQPADSGYYGTAAEEDLRGIRQEYQRKGILFVAAAIGDDKPSIERIYGDSFLDITDLNQLPMKLTAVVKRHIRL